MRLALIASLLCLPLAAQKAKAPEKAPAKVEEKAAKIDWDGEWKLKPAQSDKLPEAIEEHVKDLNFLQKTLWKKKLEKACPTFEKLDIFASETFSATLGKEVPLDTALDGTASEWKNREGEKFLATLKKEGTNLTQVLKAEGYTLTLRYAMRADGKTLALQVTYESPKLANPFSYKLVFKKED